MNICLVIISNGWGGGETFVFELARSLKEKGENVSIILNQEIHTFYKNLKGVEIFNIGFVYNHMMLIKSVISAQTEVHGETNLSIFPWSMLNEFLRPIYFKKIGKKILKYLSDKNIDIIHSSLENADILVSRLKGLKIPWIGTIHGLHLLKLIEYNSIRSILELKKRKARMLEKALGKMDNITFVSNWLLNVFRKIISLKGKGIAVHNGIKVSDFQKDLLPTLKLKGKFNLLFPGGKKPVKGGAMLIETIYKVKSEIPNIHLYIALNVPRGHFLRRRAEDLGLEDNITFLGFLQKDKYREYLNSVDVFILPSKIETFSLTNLEAMALGKSIITSDCGGIPEFVKNGKNGILIKPNIDQVANAILHLYRNEDLRKEISRNNLKDIKKFDWSFVADKYIDIYRKAWVSH